MAYETTLDDWQKPEREDEGYGWPDHGVQPYRRVGPVFLDKDHEGANDVADHENRHVGRCVVSALMKQFLATMRAGVVDLEIGAKHLAFAAIGTTAAHALANGLPCVAGGIAAVLIGRGARRRSCIKECVDRRRLHLFFLPFRQSF